MPVPYDVIHKRIYLRNHPKDSLLRYSYPYRVMSSPVSFGIPTLLLL